MVIALRAELQNILYTLTSSKLDDALAAVREGNQTISSTLATFIGEMKSLFLDAVKIEYEYYIKREAARQEQLELRAKMREASKFTAEIEKLSEQAQDAEKGVILLLPSV